jgi:hypothetical protein
MARRCRCGKARSYDRIGALLALAEIRAKDSPRRSRIERRAYECRVGRWHLTSQPRRSWPWV